MTNRKVQPRASVPEGLEYRSNIYLQQRAIKGGRRTQLFLKRVASPYTHIDDLMRADNRYVSPHLDRFYEFDGPEVQVLEGFEDAWLYDFR